MSDFGIERYTAEDAAFRGSRFAEVRESIFANPYPRPLPRFPVTFWSVVFGLFGAARRVVKSDADLRWGPDRKGFRRLVHANGVCLTGTWEITEETPYSGYFRRGSRGLIVGRYSTCCTETRRGRTRSLALAARIYPTLDRDHPDPLPTANFITQEDIGGADSRTINDAVLRNAPNTTATRRGLLGIPTLLVTGVYLTIADKQATIRQLYQVAELGLAAGETSRTPQFMQLTVVPEQPRIEEESIDVRDEIAAQIERHGSLKFAIETTDDGETHGLPVLQRRTFANWRRIGTITFTEAVASYNGDRVLHFNHPKWRTSTTPTDSPTPPSSRAARRSSGPT